MFCVPCICEDQQALKCMLGSQAHVQNMWTHFPGCCCQGSATMSCRAAFLECTAMASGAAIDSRAAIGGRNHHVQSVSPRQACRPDDTQLVSRSV